MRFHKERMISRLQADGRGEMITDEILAIMDNLDGQEATEQCWRRRVYGEPVLLVTGKNGKQYHVNENDCA